MTDMPAGESTPPTRRAAPAALTSNEERPYSRWTCVRQLLTLSKYGLGLFLILCVTVIWVAASEWIQWIFGDLDFNKPYFLTYFNTTGFMLWNLGYLFVPSWRRIPFWRVPSDRYEGEELKAYLESERSAAASTAGTTGEDPELLLDGGAEKALGPDDVDGSSASRAGAPVQKKGLLRYSDGMQYDFDVNVEKPPYSFMKLWTCAALFCPAWFVANYLFNLSLSMTSVASNTILSATSTIWTLLLSYVLLRIAVGPLRWVGVVVVMAGSLMVGLTDAGHEGDTIYGDIIALVSAMFYAVYTSVLRWCLPDDDRYGMGQVFGAVGVLNFLVLWFPIPILNVSGYETWSFPTAQQAWPLVVNALIGTNLSDVLWARSVILTSPVVATLGLSLTTPLSMVVDAILHHATYKAQYICGAILVVAGFVAANLPFEVTWTMLFRWLCCRGAEGDAADEPADHREPVGIDGEEEGDSGDLSPDPTWVRPEPEAEEDEQTTSAAVV